MGATNGTTTLSTAAKTVSGNWKGLTFGTASQCSTWTGNANIQKAGVALTGGVTKAMVAACTSSTCTSPRRLREDGRKLAANTKTDVAFTISIPKGKPYNAATVTSNLKDQTKIKAGVIAAGAQNGGNTFSVASVTPTVTAVTDTSDAKSLHVAMGALLVISLQGLL